MINYSAKRLSGQHRGAVLVMVLWLTTLGLILVTAIATNVRLSATTVINQQEALQRWSSLLETIQKAHLELMIQKMDRVVVKETTTYREKSNETLFDGRALDLHYPAPKGMTVRIYDLSGKINISRLTETKLKQLLEHLLGEHHKDITELVDAWFDWTDKNELKRINGAEKQYYEKQELGYVPRNGLFSSVDELRLIKGFQQVFDEIDVEKVFTLHGSISGVVNPNVASKKVLLMVPGIDEKIADDIIKARKTQVFKKFNELSILLPPSVITKAKSWFTFRKSNYYAIAVYPTEFEGKSEDAKKITAYVEEVRLINNQTLPVVLRVLPNAEIIIDE